MSSTSRHIVTITLHADSHRDRLLTFLFNHASGPGMNFDSDDLNHSRTMPIGFGGEHSLREATEFALLAREHLKFCKVSDPEPAH